MTRMTERDAPSIHQLEARMLYRELIEYLEDAAVEAERGVWDEDRGTPSATGVEAVAAAAMASDLAGRFASVLRALKIGDEMFCIGVIGRAKARAERTERAANALGADHLDASNARNALATLAMTIDHYLPSNTRY